MSMPPLHTALHSCHRAHRARLAELLAPHGLHPGQDALLVLLWSEPGLRQAMLAERLGVEPPTISRVVARMERSGLVERRRDPHDARLWRVHPTPRSRLLEASVRRAWTELEEEMTRALGTEGSHTLSHLLHSAGTTLSRSPEQP